MSVGVEGGGFGVFAGVAATIGQNVAEKYGGTLEERKRKHFETLHQVPLGAVVIPITAGAGVFQMNDILMPKAGYMWSIRRLTLSGFSAGTAVAYKGGAVVGGAYTGGGDPFPFSAAGTLTLGRGEGLLDQGDALVIVCGVQPASSGGGGTAITLNSGSPGVLLSGAADCFERWYLPEYLG